MKSFRAAGGRDSGEVQRAPVDEVVHLRVQESRISRHRDDGKFTIPNVPPGTYTVTVWQEKYGNKTASVTVRPKESRTVDVSFNAASGD